ncbi:MAG: helix-turn-helix transcriptional regulator [Planctomycetia bacterium]|jgi:hypothetical protein
MDEQNIYKKLADQIVEIAGKKGQRLNKSEVARKLGVSPTYIYQFMNGGKMPVDTINQILDLYGYELAPVQKKTL